MKFVTCFMIFILLAFPYNSASATPLVKNAITLTSDEVDSADDIEAAIISITSSGTQPGTVIMDGQNGAFIMTSDDRSLNIFVSNLTLRGVNGAMIVNCDDGLFFDDFPLQQIQVEGITFICTGDGVEATGDFQEVTLRDNIFWVENDGIAANGHSNGWLISDNYIQAGGDGINISGAGNVIISDNDLSGNNGVVLLRSTQSHVRHNVIHATYQGILIGQNLGEYGADELYSRRALCWNCTRVRGGR